MPASAPPSPHLLLADENPAIQGILTQALEEMGYSCTGASSLQQALLLVHHQPFDLILTDTFSPTASDALKTIQPLLALAYPIPVIVCSAWPLTNAGVQQEGFAGLVQKPFDLEELITIVAESLNHPFNETQRQQAEIVTRCVTALIQGDGETLIALCAEDIQFYPWIVPAYPVAHPVSGRAAIRVYLQILKHYFGGYHVELNHLYPCPRGIAVRLLLQWHDPNGMFKQQMVAWCVKVSDGGYIQQVGLPLPDERLRALLRPLIGR